MVDFPKVICNYGDVVFVRIGANTVKMGTIAGVRISLTPCPGAVHPTCVLQFLVKWWDRGDRADAYEWWDAQFVCTGAQHAFDKSPSDDRNYHDYVQWPG